MQPYSYSHYQPTAETPPVAARRFDPVNQSAVALAAVGLILVLFTALPAGLITGPMALLRVREYERGVAQGRYSPAEQSNFTAARVMAWLSILFSLPWLLLGLFVLFVLCLA